MQRPKRPADYVRCSGCGRLTEKANARPGPEGGRYGAECYELAVRASLTDPLAEARAIAADLGRTTD